MRRMIVRMFCRMTRQQELELAAADARERRRGGAAVRRRRLKSVS